MMIFQYIPKLENFLNCIFNHVFKGIMEKNKRTGKTVKIFCNPKNFSFLNILQSTFAVLEHLELSLVFCVNFEGRKDYKRLHFPLAF